MQCHELKGAMVAVPLAELAAIVAMSVFMQRQEGALVPLASVIVILNEEDFENPVAMIESTELVVE